MHLSTNLEHVQYVQFLSTKNDNSSPTQVANLISESKSVPHQDSNHIPPNLQLWFSSFPYPQNQSLSLK